MSAPTSEQIGQVTAGEQADIDSRLAVEELARAAQGAAATLRTLGSGKLNEALLKIADLLEDSYPQILQANALDMQRGRENGMSAGLLDRLELSQERVRGLAQAVRQVAALPSPVGQVVAGNTLENGLQVRQVRVPIGVVAMIYEARPGVTVDAAALALKTGNAVLLRGGSAALHSNQALVEVIRQGLAAAGLPPQAVTCLDHLGRPAVKAVLQARGLVDLAIPRGGAQLINMVVREAQVPVIETGVGNCHIYIDASADLAAATPIVINAKTQRLGVCNAAETLLVHQQIAASYLPEVLSALRDKGVALHLCPQAADIAAQHGLEYQVATEADWETEYLSADIAVRVVADVDQAIAHIGRYSTGHTEAVLAQDVSVIDRFVAQVDSAALAINASTRFTDGGEMGLGAEIGISTQKLHARGPMGLAALTTTKWIIHGQGHVRP